jgi:hypothetical protein
MYKFIYRVLPKAVKSITAFANDERQSCTVSLSIEQELAIGTGLQYIILNPFW